jgi:K+-sensing histidine kinase KdpD
MKSIFIANVSHELRTPLALICGPAEQLIRDEEDEGKIKLLNIIQANGYIVLKVKRTDIYIYLNYEIANKYKYMSILARQRSSRTIKTRSRQVKTGI